MRNKRTLKQMMAGMLTIVTILGTMQAPVSATLPTEDAEVSVRSVLPEEDSLDEISPAYEELATDETEETLLPVEEEEEQIPDAEDAENAEAAEEPENEQEEVVTEDQLLDSQSVGEPLVECDPVDAETGQFVIHVKNCTLAAGEKIVIPVWQDEKQKDLVWNTATLSGSEYIVRESVAAHGYRTGEYKVHVYKKSSTGALTFLVKTSVQITPETETLTTERVQNQENAVLSGVKLYGVSDSVRLAVWSDVNGQDDLVWENAVKTADGVWSAQMPLNKHSGTGVYHVHAYAYTKTGAPVFLKKTTFTVDGISAGSIQASGPDPATGTFTVTVSNITAPFGISKIQVPIWSKADQSDIYWYTAEKKGDSYVATCNLSKHKNNTGTYQIHVYLTDQNGYRSYLTRTTMKADPVAAPQVDNFTAASNNGNFVLSADRITAGFAIKSVEIAVWNKADQSDLVWYTAVKDGDRYSVSSSIAKHKNHTGTYQAHLYLQRTDGKMIFGAKTSFTATMGNPALQVTASADRTNYQVTLSNFPAPSDNGQVRIAVWSEENGQDDLKWYTAKVSGENQIVTVPVANHRSTGTYQAHAYVFRPDNSFTFICKTPFEVTGVAVNSVKVSNVDHNQGRFDIRVTAADNSGIDAVRTAVWSKADQSNLVWYQMNKQTDGTWTATMQFENHGKLYGVYHVHAYAVMKDGSMKLLGVTDTELKESNRVVAEKISDTACKITLYGANLDGKTPESVLFPTWSKQDGQDDLVWYKGVKQADGSYQVTVQLESHKHEGIFNTHIYVKYGGQEKLVHAITYTLEKPATAVRELDAEARAVMRNIIYAVETGGQVYGGHRYDCFSEAYSNSYLETAITIGAGAWFANEAKTLLTLIREKDPSGFAALDTAGIGEDLELATWKYYGSDGNGGKTILKDSPKARAIQKIISTPVGISVQDSLIDEQMVKYADQAKALGVTDLKARLFCANLEHLGGYNAMVRVINYCKNDGEALTMENLWTNMREREAGSGNTVGADLYANRHRKVMQWLDTYL